MSKYTTTEGHEIVRDGEYETGGGDRVKVVYISPDDDDSILTLTWTDSKEWMYPDWLDLNDFIRPWKDKDVKKQTLLEFMDERRGYSGEALPSDSFERREVYKNISEYLEKNM